MRRRTLHAAALAAAAALASLLPACAGTPPAAERPSLAVLIVVDQLRADLLERYDALFTGGFRRLLDESRVFTRATHDHAMTITAPGHATLSTGVWPAHSGIVGNSWFELRDGEWVEVENVEDPSVAIVGAPELTGVSPHRLLRPGLADWLVAADSASHVAAVSGKDRGAVLLAARSRGQVYWFEPAVGRFVTSTYYRSEYPEWVERFNGEVLPSYARDSVWRSNVPASALHLGQPDTAAHEADGVHTYFPHRFVDVGYASDPQAFWTWFEDTPALDVATLDFAGAAVEALGLGRDDSPDLLAVSLSQTDRIGHAYGPLSREQLDNLLRLDRALGAFLDFLDEAVGPGRYVLALSADHGAMIAPEVARTIGRPGLRVGPAEVEAFEHAVAEAQAEAAAAGDAGDVGDAAAARYLADALERLPFIAAAWTHAELDARAPAADSFMALFRHSRYAGREPGILGRLGVEVHPIEGLSTDERGSGHGSAYYYDRHVPLLFMGPAIPQGADSTPVTTVDLAPTLARLLGIAAPADLDGSALNW